MGFPCTLSKIMIFYQNSIEIMMVYAQNCLLARRRCRLRRAAARRGEADQR